jgi:hypothetical protein
MGVRVEDVENQHFSARAILKRIRSSSKMPKDKFKRERASRDYARAALNTHRGKNLPLTIASVSLGAGSLFRLC